MIWWFLILAVSVGAVAWVGIALYVRIHHHMKDAELSGQESVADTERERETGNP
jgi:hypothetical protein